MKLIKYIYVFLFARPTFFWLNRFLFKHSLYGMGILNYENEIVSGESFFIDFILKLNNDGVILDVGANIGEYSNTLRKKGFIGKLFAFEPHPNTFIKLKKSADTFSYDAIKMGMGKVAEKLMIYDYAENNGSQHASLYKDVITDIHQSAITEIEIELTTIDEFISKNNLQQINLLKIDTEGNELNVLLGAKQAITNNVIKFIQIEFNEMNVISKTFMRDIKKVLPNYSFYRLLPNTLLPLDDSPTFLTELFAFQNIIAILKN